MSTVESANNIHKMNVAYSLLKIPKTPGITTYARILVDFLAISETLIGVCLMLTGISMIDMVILYSYEVLIPLFVGLILLLKGTLLLYGIVKGHAKCILIYLVISVPVLLIINAAAFCFTIWAIFGLPGTQAVGILLPSVSCIYLVMMSLFAWSTQFSVFIIHKQLIPNNRDTC